MGISAVLLAVMCVQSGEGAGLPGETALSTETVLSGEAVSIEAVSGEHVSNAPKVAGTTEADGQPTPTPTSGAKATSNNLGLGGIVPADVPYEPLSGKQRWGMFINSTVANPALYGRSVFLAGTQHLRNKPEAWGQGWDAFGQRIGSHMLRLTVSGAIKHGTNAMMGQEPRYVSCRECTSIKRRLKHSFVYTFLTYSRQGKPALDYGGIAGQVGSEVLASSWIPGRSWRRELSYGFAEQAGFHWLANIAREFAPEIKRLLPRKR